MKKRKWPRRLPVRVNRDDHGWLTAEVGNTPAVVIADAELRAMGAFIRQSIAVLTVVEMGWRPTDEAWEKFYRAMGRLQ